MHCRRIAIALISLLTLASATQAEDHAGDALLLDSADGSNWSSYGRTYGQQHYSPLDQINAGNVGRLGLAWYLDLPPGNTVTQAIAVDGVIYAALGYSVVHAVDAATGKLLWKYDPQVHKTAGHKMFVGWGSRGIGWWNGKVYTVTHDGVAIALDAKTGKPLWRTPTLDPSDSSYVTGAPFLFDGKLIIGNSGDYGPVRGKVTALDAETGKPAWDFWVVPGNPANGFENAAMEMAAKTWAGEWWKYGGGGTPWNAFAYDPETRTVFVGTGNGAPYNYRIRSQGRGDNLFLASIVALDVDTGAYKWHYQQNPGEQWDFTATQDIELADLVIGGKQRKVLMTAPKNGFYYVIDRITGKLISAQPFVEVNWASHIDLKTGRPVENPDARYRDKPFLLRPTSFGGHNWQPMSYSPRTRLTYIPIHEFAAAYGDIPDKDLVPPSDMSYFTGITLDMGANIDGPNQAVSALIAWDPVAQRRVWEVPAPRMLAVAVTATAGNIVFQGSIDSTFNAYAADTGRKLWSVDTQAPPLAPPISYSVNGRQYVTVMTGMGSQGIWGSMLRPYNLDYRTMARRMLTYVLDGNVALPPRREPDFTPLKDDDFKPDTMLFNAGAAAFAHRCMGCHGVGAVAAGMAPDLRRSPVTLSAAAFRAVVHDGARLPMGMPRFDIVDDAELAALRHYIRARAHDPEADKPTTGPTGRGI